MKKCIRKLLTMILSVSLCIGCSVFSYAEFDPDPIPEEEQSAVYQDYYDDYDRIIANESEKIKNDFDNYARNCFLKAGAPDYRMVLQRGMRNYSINSIYANFDRTAAAAYAVAYAQSPNSYFFTLDDDCTGFVSQAIAIGGVYSYINYDFSSVPWLRNWILDTDSNYWYMIQKDRPLGLGSFWVYSNSWGMVSSFRSFHKIRAASGTNYFSGVLSGGTPNYTTNEYTNFEYKLRKYAKVGQVWQFDDEHSIIITKVVQQPDGYNYVWFSSHSSPRCNEDIQTFLTWVYNHSNGTRLIHRLDFS